MIFNVVEVRGGLIKIERNGEVFDEYFEFKDNFDFANAYTVYKAQGRTYDFDFNCILERKDNYGDIELVYREELYTMFSRATEMRLVHFDYNKFAGKVFPSMYDIREPEIVEISKTKLGAIYRITDETGKCYAGQTMNPVERLETAPKRESILERV